MIEDLGSDQFIHLSCEGVDLVARAARKSNLKSGMTVGLVAAPERIHLFHNGERMEP
jgi:ABC-type sugar transport system ATPase subunit